MKLFLYFINLTLFLTKKINSFSDVDEHLIGQRIEKGMVPEEQEEALLGVE